METRRCFLAIPMSGVFPQVRQAIAEALLRGGVKPVRIEDFGVSNRSPTEWVLDQIKTAKLVIADVTGGNPNVLYELGFAHAMQKPVLIITQDLDSAPVSITTDNLLFVYHLDDLARLQHSVSKWAARFVSRNPER